MKDGSIKLKGKVLKSGLRLGRVSKLGSEVQVKRTNCTEVLKRWRFLVEYGEPPARKSRRCVTDLRQSCYPDDALSSADHSKTSKKLYTMEPSSEPLNLQFKYRPVKNVFVSVALQRWNEHPKVYLESVLQQERVLDYYIRSEARARWLRMVLVDMVKELKSQPWSAKYQQNCNRWRERESGPLCVLEDLLIIMKPRNLSKTRVNGADIFYLNDTHKDEHLAWSIVTQKCMVEESIRRLTKFIDTWDLVVAEKIQTPRTLSMYVTSYTKILSLLKKGDSYRLRGDYLPAWTARGYLLDLIFQSGFMEVSIDRQVSLEQFLSVNPDQHDHLRKLLYYFARVDDKKPQTVSQFLARALGTAAMKCNALTCSMWLCFGDDRGFYNKDFNNSSNLWREAAKKYVKEHGMMPHPVIVAHSLRQRRNI